MDFVHIFCEGPTEQDSISRTAVSFRNMCLRGGEGFLEEAKSNSGDACIYLFIEKKEPINCFVEIYACNL